MDELELARAERNRLRREQYRLDGDRRREENKRWKEAHREQVLEAGRKYARLRRGADLEAARAREKEWRAANKDKVAAANKRNYSREYHREWAAKNRVKDPVLYMFRNAKNRAKELGREFSLTRADIVVPDTCPVLGLSLAKGTTGFQPNSPSIDRIDSAKGYVPGNVCVISWRANALKRDGTLDEFRKIVAYMERIGAT